MIGGKGVHCLEHLARFSISASRGCNNLFCLGDRLGLNGFIYSLISSPSSIPPPPPPTPQLHTLTLTPLTSGAIKASLCPLGSYSNATGEPEIGVGFCKRMCKQSSS